VYVGAIGAAARDRDMATAFLRELTGEGAAGILKLKGMDAPNG
jgi:hypothetical protein